MFQLKEIKQQAQKRAVVTGDSIRLRKEMEEEMARSIKRLSNYDYALALKKAGYAVPDKFLKKD